VEPFISENIGDILVITGAITAAGLAQFISPKPFLREIHKIDMPDEAPMLFARHWGLLSFVIGGLLMYAGRHPEVRIAAVTAALIAKAGFAALVAKDFGKPYMRGLRAAAFFDVACVLIFAVWLLDLN
jgi:hypothetical protein